MAGDEIAELARLENRRRHTGAKAAFDEPKVNSWNNNVRIQPEMAAESGGALV
jgi:hypothetical protein